MPQIILPAAVPSLSIGGRVFTDVSNLKILGASFDAVTTVNGTFRLPNTTAGYQVPASKKFVVMAIVVKIFESTAAASTIGMRLQYSDNDVGLQTSTALTNAVAVFGSNQASSFGTLANTSLSSQFQEAVYFEVPAAKYLTGINISAKVASALVYGYEVPA